MIRTLSAVADAKQIQAGESTIHIGLEVEEGDPWRSTLSISLNLDKNLSLRERAILTNSAKACEVSKMLSGNISLDYHQTLQD